MTAGHDPGRPPHEPVRVCVLWSRLSGYLAASLHTLVDEGAELLVVHEAAAPSAPFDDGALTAGFRSLSWTGAPDRQAVENLVDAFAPDVVVVNSWHIGAYRRVARRLRGRALRIVTVHNQWTATPKQLAARAAAPILLHPTYDAAFVCDERQAVFAEKLGFPAERLLWGVNTCDQPQFAAVAAARGGASPPPAFLFAGRLVDDKAIDVLAAAYRRYRAGRRGPVAADRRRHRRAGRPSRGHRWRRDARLRAAVRASCRVRPGRHPRPAEHDSSPGEW